MSREVVGIEDGEDAFVGRDDLLDDVVGGR
jgi:hypothetical protein